MICWRRAVPRGLTRMSERTGAIVRPHDLPGQPQCGLHLLEPGNSSLYPSAPRRVKRTHITNQMKRVQRANGSLAQVWGRAAPNGLPAENIAKLMRSRKNALCRAADSVLRLNLSSSVQSRNTQRSERQQRFPEPEVVILIRTAPRQPPRSGCLGRLSGKCYTGKSTGQVEACLIPIAVGGSSTAFSRRSVKTGGNRNASPGSTPSLSGLPIVHAA